MLLTIPFALCSFLRVAAAAACNSDNCYRAVLGSAFTTRHGSADCSSYFKVTVTPATLSATVTVTETVYSTALDSVTSTLQQISLTTATVTFDSTDINILTSTLLQTDIVTETDTVTEIPTTTLAPMRRDDVHGRGPNISARQATQSASSIPAYASPCSGAVRYSSACSCLGHTPETTTLAAPVTTVTVTMSSTALATSTESVTLTLVTFETIFTSMTEVFSTTTTTTVTSVTSATSTTLTTQECYPSAGIPVPPPACTVFRDNLAQQWAIFWSAQGVTRDSGNERPPFAPVNFPGTYDICQAVEACAAVSAPYVKGETVNIGFDLYRLADWAEDEWVCVFIPANGHPLLPSSFDIPNCDVELIYGYYVTGR
ncbi:hypothetical protein EG329_005681 [Mollisiaceae sp. DMI_Dod_QoI]|nr:hypothetical protein EG329_005681 [Helotiales sp. DMI_Dod_QoI]